MDSYISLGLSGLGPLQLGGQTSNSFLQSKPRALEQQKISEVTSQNWHLVFIGRTGSPLVLTQTICLERQQVQEQKKQLEGRDGKLQNQLYLDPFSTGSVAPNTTRRHLLQAPNTTTNTCYISEAVVQWVNCIWRASQNSGGRRPDFRHQLCHITYRLVEWRYYLPYQGCCED